MKRSNRLFEIIQILRAASRPKTAEQLSEHFEVSVRTIYRDIAALQAMETPIDGEPGIGYIMRRGYDLPPLNFELEEIEALRVALALLSRTGDMAFERAANSIHEKIDALHGPADWLQVAPWGVPKDDPKKGCVSMSLLRDCIRSETKIQLTYRKNLTDETIRKVRPVGIIYHVECVMLAAWCELRAGFRHFRTDRVFGCEVLEEKFAGEGAIMRKLWLEQSLWDYQNAQGETITP